MTDPKLVDVDTPEGPARVHVYRPRGPRSALLLGHGAGGGVAAPDLLTARDVALGLGWAVALIEQPYRVAGKSSVAPTHKLDIAQLAIAERLARRELKGLRQVTGGRSSGARVACRTATETGAVGVLCLAFPLLPPSRSGPPKSRLPELQAVKVPMLVVQGVNDRFGVPRSGGLRKVVRIKGDHGLKSDKAALGAAVEDWLGALLP